MVRLSSCRLTTRCVCYASSSPRCASWTRHRDGLRDAEAVHLLHVDRAAQLKDDSRDFQLIADLGGVVASD